MDELMQIPELDDAQFYTEVMQLGVDRNEAQHDRDLLAKAFGLGIMATLPAVSETHRLMSSAMSDSTESTSRDQAFSSVSDASTMTYPTPHSSIYGASSPKLSSADNNVNNHSVQKAQTGGLEFSLYDKYLAHTHRRARGPRSESSTRSIESSSQSIFSVSSRRSLSGVTSGFRNRIKLGKKSSRICENPIPRSCFKCHASLSDPNKLQILPCGHANCSPCLRDLTVEAIKDESTMPPSCCAKPVPSDILQNVLDADSQESFFKAVLQYSTPLESRIFCCNQECGEFIPHTTTSSTVTCPTCQSKACSLCKKDAHAIGTHCPEDWELLDALKIGGNGSWTRCYRCRKLVELTDSTAPVTCVCKAQFCFSCGGVWDIVTGCPNVCKGGEDLLRRQDEEQKRAAEAEAAEALQQEESAKRSMDHPEVQSLLEAQRREMQRMLNFKEAALSSLKARQSAKETALAVRHVEDREELMREYARDTSKLEDRQIDEELDLRSTLDQAARTIKVRIKHMEAYCDGLGQNPTSSNLPPRVVTEQNLRDLSHQYNLRDDVERQHQAKINMMRDRQSKRMDELIQKHEAELDALTKRNRKSYMELGESLLRERKIFDSVFEARQSRLTARWALAIEVQCKQLQERDGLRYSTVAPPSWPEPTTTDACAS